MKEDSVLIVDSQKKKNLIVRFKSKRITSEIEIAKIDERLNRLVDRERIARLILDFANVTQISSAFLNNLVLLLKRCKKEKVDLKLCSLDKTLFEMFRICRFDRLFDIYANVEGALM